ncbi:MAG: hypothetical protein PHS92_01445 [Candidatus Gracilibacteria bacterium]|nr:hypothetical protein [Candidatus Gracilibacteria bacterium]
MTDKISETKKCICGSSFDITGKDKVFYDMVSPIFNGIKYQIPSPNICPDCRQQRRLAFRMERNLYRRKCDFTGKSLISMYSPDKKDIVYDYDIWWSDKWSAFDHGTDFDFSRPFFEQFHELFMKVPKAHIEISPSENSEYTNQAGYNKNCYLIFEAGYCEDSMYSNSIWNSKDTMDSSFVNYADNCYECLDVKRSFALFYSQECENCSDSSYLTDCQNCQNCLGCWNLRGKQYHILNKPVSKESYEKTICDIKKDPEKKRDFLKILYNEKKDGVIGRDLHNIGSENAIGNNISESNDCSGFDIQGSRNCTDSYSIYDSVDCKDYSYWGNKSSLIYESTSIGNIANKILFSWMCYENINDIIYSMNCVNGSSYLFGCVGMKNSSYCILNKQYTREEYEILVPKIIEHMKTIGEWGEFFPANLSPFGYNETVAMEYYPISSSDSINRIATDGKPIFNWSDYENPIVKVEKTIPADKLPDDIIDIPDDIVNWAILCEISGKPFRIMKKELDFYRKHSLPISRRHPDIRHMDRMSMRNLRKIYDSVCFKCSTEIRTTYAPEENKIVYCQQCYDKEVY